MNENFYSRLISTLPEGFGLLGSLEHALLTLTYPHIKETKSALLSTTLRLGDVEVRESEAIELNVRVAKCTSLARAASWKKFFKKDSDEEDIQDAEDEGKAIYKEVKRRTEYVIDRSTEEEEGKEKEPTTQDISIDVDEEKSVVEEETRFEKVEKEQLIKGFKYGSTYVPCPDGQFERLNTKKGIEICGFFQRKNVRLLRFLVFSFN